MPKFSYEADTRVPPERVIAALTDFSDDRPNLWPTLDRKYYKVHSVGRTSADVTEGSSVFGGFAGREHYDWATPGVVRATVQESNIAVARGTWEFRVQPGAAGGSHISVVFDRQMKGAKGTLLSVFLGLFAKQAFRSNLIKTLKILEAQQASAHQT